MVRRRSAKLFGRKGVQRSEWHLNRVDRKERKKEREGERVERCSTKHRETRRRGIGEGEVGCGIGRTEGVTRRTDAVGMFSQKRRDHLYPLPPYPPAIGVICRVPLPRGGRILAKISRSNFFPRNEAMSVDRFEGKCGRGGGRPDESWPDRGEMARNLSRRRRDNLARFLSGERARRHPSVRACIPFNFNFLPKSLSL